MISVVDYFELIVTKRFLEENKTVVRPSQIIEINC